MCIVVDQLQGASTEPPGNMGVRPGIRPSPDPEGRSPAVSASQQPQTTVHQPEGD